MKSRGRPRSFDPDLAAQSAMRAFWAMGYDGVAINDLPGILGASKPTIYAAFHSKEGLYSAALAAYERLCVEPELDQLSQEIDLVDGVTHWLRSGADRYLGALGLRGCFIVRASMEGFADDSMAGRALFEKMRHAQLLLEVFLSRCHPDPAENIQHLAGYLLTVRNGMAVAAMSGADRGFLDAVIARSLRSL